MKIGDIEGKLLRFRVGDAAVSITDNGDSAIRLIEITRIPEGEWDEKYSESFNTLRLFPSQSAYISLPERKASILVDPNDYSLSNPPGSEYSAPASYIPPPGYIDQLKTIGVLPSDITQVIITHAHYDHYAGITTRKNDSLFVPTFPNAKCYLGRRDWERKETQDELKKQGSEVSNSLAVIKKEGLLDLVDGRLELFPEVSLIPAPGESPGHQIVRLSSGKKVFYCLGDLFHDPAEVEHQSWMSTWAEQESNVRSRSLLTKAAIEEDALLLASHMPIGRLSRKSSGAVEWVPEKIETLQKD